MTCPHCQSARAPKTKGIRNGKLRRVCRDCGKYFPDQVAVGPRYDAPKPKIPESLQAIADRYTPEEIRLLAQGHRHNPEQRERPVINFDGHEFVAGFCTDTHWGSQYSPREYWTAFLTECRRLGVKTIFHSGDVTEGMSNRPDHVYSLTHIGYSAQIDYAVELFNEASDFTIYVIDGNHDRWGIKSGGVMVVQDIAKRCPHVHYLGHDEADIPINGTIWRMFHGEDGSSYATSYRVQKLIESFTGGTKPHVLLVGHTHKEISMFERNIYAVSGGAMCRQSSWMRSKKLVNHDGFHILRATIGEGQVKSFSATFYPFFN